MVYFKKAEFWRGAAIPRTLNEGRGINPGDTRPRRECAGVRHDAQRRPGHQPRRHRPRRRHRPQPCLRSTKAGASTPATQASPTPPPSTMSALNEGRGINPGDTVIVQFIAFVVKSAQRRPGHQPRRHSSSNPGSPSTSSAQRRPGHQPRRHFVISLSEMVATRRAQRRPGHQPRRHTPRPPHFRQTSFALNEGRGINPGDTGLPRLALTLRRTRSTKAGASTPATLELLRLDEKVKDAAQRRPGHQPRRHSRVRMIKYARIPLNEGRGINPGDTARRTQAPPCRTALNEGRGINPGDTRDRRTA